jgi:hypothetical protein
VISTVCSSGNYFCSIINHSVEVTFTNEIGNSIDMKVCLDETTDTTGYDTVTVYAKGPTPITGHLWTRKKAEVLLNNLSMVLNRPLAE